MNCREFDQAWNELLDDRSTAAPDRERALEAHASTCEGCRLISTRYLTLRQAVSSWTPPPSPSAASLERLYALRVPDQRRVITLRKRPRLVRWLPMASAAGLLALAWLGWPARPLPENLAPIANPVMTTSRTQQAEIPRPLGSALAEATEATINLAREASAPATRIAREILDLDKLNALTTTEKPTVAFAVASPASNLITTVGERVNASVKPISGSARHAFGFLFGPPPGADPDSTKSQGSL